MSHPPRTESALLAGTSGIAHGFFGRQGGVSQGLYASLNAGPGSDDDAGHVTANRARIAAALGAREMASCYQVHGTEVAMLAEKPDTRPRADAMVTRAPGLALCILTADCVPVLFADAEAGVIGAAHAGWRGAVAGVTEACVRAMVAAGARLEHIRAAIGPAIQQASYEVGPDLHAAVLETSPWAGGHFVPGQGDRLQFDLPAYVETRLARAGIDEIDRLADDTCALDADYFSNRRRIHRGEADYGRNASVIALCAP